jgi:hypothetical protein
VESVRPDGPTTDDVKRWSPSMGRKGEHLVTDACFQARFGAGRHLARVLILEVQVKTRPSCPDGHVEVEPVDQAKQSVDAAYGVAAGGDSLARQQERPVTHVKPSP